MYTKQPKLQISMLRSRGASKIRSGARRMSGVTGFLHIFVELNVKSELNVFRY